MQKSKTDKLVKMFRFLLCSLLSHKRPYFSHFVYISLWFQGSNMNSFPINFFRLFKTSLTVLMKPWWKPSRKVLTLPMKVQYQTLKKCRNGRYWAKIFPSLEANWDLLWKWRGILFSNNMQIWSMDSTNNEYWRRSFLNEFEIFIITQ